jgi:DNA-directed RNA polymerase omega subunit
MDDTVRSVPVGAKVSDTSKFRLILVIAKRARQLQAGAKPLMYTLATKATRIAREESRAGLLPFELITAEPLPKSARKTEAEVA